MMSRYVLYFIGKVFLVLFLHQLCLHLNIGYGLITSILLVSRTNEIWNVELNKEERNSFCHVPRRGSSLRQLVCISDTLTTIMFKCNFWQQNEIRN